MAKTILIADDDHFVRQAMAGLLRGEGFNVATANDGQSALDAAIMCHPDLVLLDIEMPKMDGVEACRRIKQHPATCSTPIMLVSGMAEDDARTCSEEAGADDFLSKPVSPRVLLSRVETFIRAALSKAS